MKDHVASDIGVKATLFRANYRDNAVRRRRDGAGRRPGRHEGPEADTGVALLGGSDVGQGKNSDDGREEGKLSQEKPPIKIVIDGKMQPPNHLDAIAWTMHSS